MVGNKRKIFILVSLIFLTYGCSGKRGNEAPADKSDEQITGFSLKQFADDKTSFILQGESAEISTKTGTTISTPELSLSTSTETIEITTGKEGKGAIKIIPDAKKVNNIIITGNISIVYRDIKTGVVTMQGKCGKLTYNNSEKMIIMENSPVITRNKSRFGGDVIYYRIDTSTVELKGNVNARIYSEEKTVAD